MTHTTATDAILRDGWCAGIGSRAIAARLAHATGRPVSRNVVIGRARRLGLTGLGLRPSHAPSRADDERALAAIRAVGRGVTIGAAARAFGVDRDFLGALVREARVA